jgi:hypothetical protein
MSPTQAVVWLERGKQYLLRCDNSTSAMSGRQGHSAVVLLGFWSRRNGGASFGLGEQLPIATPNWRRRQTLIIIRSHHHTSL